MSKLKSKYIKNIKQVVKLNDIEYTFRADGFFGRIKTKFCDDQLIERVKEVYCNSNKQMLECECGKDIHGFASHSFWCPKKE